MLFNPKPMRTWSGAVLFGRAKGEARNLALILNTLERWDRDHAVGGDAELTADGMVLSAAHNLNWLRFRVELGRNPDKQAVRAGRERIERFSEFLREALGWTFPRDRGTVPYVPGTPFLISGVPLKRDMALPPIEEIQAACAGFTPGFQLEVLSTITLQLERSGRISPFPTWAVEGLLDTGASEQQLANFASEIARIAHWRNVLIHRFGLETTDLEYGCSWSAITP